MYNMSNVKKSNRWTMKIIKIALCQAEVVLSKKSNVKMAHHPTPTTVRGLNSTHFGYRLAMVHTLAWSEHGWPVG